MKFKLSSIIDLALKKYLRTGAVRNSDKCWFSCSAIYMAAGGVMAKVTKNEIDKDNGQQYQFSEKVSRRLKHVAFEGFGVEIDSCWLFKEFEPDSSPTKKSQYARAMWLTFLQLWLRETPDMDIIEFNVEKYK